jgi:two-component system OmpR family sensor kinase
MDARADLNAIAIRVAAELVPFADVKGAEIEVLSDGAPVMVQGQEDAIALALTNLIENAVIHAGGRISVQVGPGAEIAVSDAGPGLPETDGALFEPFRRGKGAARGGAGLGLAIVARIQRAHGGAVTVTSTPEAGTVFRLSFRAA